MADRLYRSPNDRVIAGVAGGLATWLRVDPSIVRILWVILAIVTGGIFVLLYIVMMIVVPLPPPGWVPTPGPPLGSQPGQWAAPPAGAAPPPGSQPPGAQPGQWVPPAGGAPTWQGPDTTNAGIVAGFILVGIGIWFLVDQYIKIDWQLLWPVIVIAIGAALIVAAVRRNRPAG